MKKLHIIIHTWSISPTRKVVETIIFTTRQTGELHHAKASTAVIWPCDDVPGV